MQELAREAVARRRSPYSGSPQTGCPIAWKWARIWCVRPVSRRTRSSVAVGSASLDLEVGARLARLVGVDRLARAHAPVAADRRVDRAAARRRAPVDEREVLAHDPPRRERRLEARGAPPRSSRRRAAPRCRGRGGARCPAATARRPPRRAPASACESVPLAVRARPGARRRPAGLSTTSRSLVLVGDRERRGVVVGAPPRAAPPRRSSIVSPPRSAVVLARGRRRRA